LIERHQDRPIRLAARGFSRDVWTDPPGRVWEDYRHAVDEVVMVLEGEVEFDIAGNVVRPAPGKEVLIQAGALHTCETSAPPRLNGCTAAG